MSAQQKSKKSTPGKKGRQDVTEEVPKKTTVVEVEVPTISNGVPDVQVTEPSKKTTKKSTTKKTQVEQQKPEEDFQETSQVKQEPETKGQKKTKKQKEQTSQPEDKDTNTESQTTERKTKKSSSKRQVSQFRGGELTFEKLSLKDDADSATSAKSRHINGYQKFQSVMSKHNPNFGDRAKEWGKLSKEQKKYYNDTSLETLVEETKKSGK